MIAAATLTVTETWIASSTVSSRRSSSDDHGARCSRPITGTATRRGRRRQISRVLTGMRSAASFRHVEEAGLEEHGMGGAVAETTQALWHRQGSRCPGRRWSPGGACRRRWSPDQRLGHRCEPDIELARRKLRGQRPDVRLLGIGVDRDGRRSLSRPAAAGPRGRRHRRAGHCGPDPRAMTPPGFPGATARRSGWRRGRDRRPRSRRRRSPRRRWRHRR